MPDVAQVVRKVIGWIPDSELKKPFSQMSFLSRCSLWQ